MSSMLKPTPLEKDAIRNYYPHYTLKFKKDGSVEAKIIGSKQAWFHLYSPYELDAHVKDLRTWSKSSGLSPKLHEYLNTLPKGMSRKSVETALTIVKDFDGFKMPRASFIETKLRQGWKVFTRSGYRNFGIPGRYSYEESRLTKTAMDYAEYLQAKESFKRGGFFM